MNKTLPLIAVLALWLLALSTATAQGPNNDQIENSGGTLYVVAFPDTTMNTFDARYPNRAYVDKAILFIYSAVDSRVSIKGKGFNNTINTTGGRFTVVELMGSSGTNAANPIVTVHCEPVGNTFRIESEQPIIVYQYLLTKFGTEAWTPAPVEAWGTEYYAAAMPGEIGSNISPGGEFDYNRRNKMFPAEIVVVAAYDDTRITIVPNGQVHNNCRAENVTLKAGEAYSIQSYVDTLTANVGVAQPDFGGSRIFSTKPVGVITGNTRAMLVDESVGLGKNIFRNMQIEWLRPVEQFGTEFVYLPTWDSLRPSIVPGGDTAAKRMAEFVRIYASDEDPTEGSYLEDGEIIPYDEAILQGRFAQIRHRPSLARVHRTDQPAQAMMQSAAVVKYVGTTQGFGGYIGSAYDGWGGYMVELTPREQWSSFAPFYASSNPGGLAHYINVVTDTAHRNDVYLKSGARFVFDQGVIEGTDLVWGSMKVSPGIDNHLEGRNGARFAGYVYGGLVKGGHEEYRPGRVKDRDENPPTSANGGGIGDDPEILHPSEYEEYLAIAYGYPLASSRLVIGAGDSLGIRTTSDCSGMCIEVESLNENPTGLRSVRLDNVMNAKIASQNPIVLTGAVRSTICIGPINPQQDASATVVIKDQTGKVTRVPFEYYAERLNASQPELLFGVMTPGIRATRSIWLTNPMGRALTIIRGELVVRNQGFTVASPTNFPITIAPGDSVRFDVEARPMHPDRGYVDTLRIESQCMVKSIVMKAETADPCVNVGDLDFGTLAPGQSRTLALRITNDGSGVVTFSNPTGDSLITWLLTSFTVDTADLAALRTAILGRGDVTDVRVTFTATSEGIYRDTARIWASVRKCRDTSVWTARVSPSTSAPLELTGGTWLGAVVPNPVDDVAEISYSLERPVHTTIVLYDERGARVRTIIDEPRAAGTHVVRVDVASLPAGVYHYRLSAGATSQSRSFVRR